MPVFDVVRLPRNRDQRAAVESHILLFFVWLLIFVLPFICWGEWAQPGHAHGSPHVVFAPPGHPEGHWHPVGYTHPQDQDGPVGQARPDTSLVITALLIVGTALVWRIALQASSRRLPLHLQPLAWLPAVPSPPPRTPSGYRAT